MTWPSAAPPLNKSFSIGLESEHLELQAPKWTRYPRYGFVCAVLSDLWDLSEKQDQGIARFPTEERHQKSEQTQTSFSLPVSLLMDLSWDGLDVGLDGRLPNS